MQILSLLPNLSIYLFILSEGSTTWMIFPVLDGYPDNMKLVNKLRKKKKRLRANLSVVDNGLLSSNFTWHQ